MEHRLLWAVFVLSRLLLFSAEEGSGPVATCPENFQCGNRSFMFPFTDVKHYNCGLSMVRCDQGSFPSIALKYPAEQWFEAKSIENSTMTLIDPRLKYLFADNHSLQSCLIFYYDIFLPNSPSISFRILNNITLFRCQEKTNQKLNDFFHGYGYGYYGGCGNFSLFYKYPNSLSLTTPPVGSIDPSCIALYLPMNKIVSPDNKSRVPEIFRLLGTEFDLRWHVSEDCYECHHKGGVCQTEWSNGTHCINDEGSLGIAIAERG